MLFTSVSVSGPQGGGESCCPESWDAMTAVKRCKKRARSTETIKRDLRALETQAGSLRRVVWSLEQQAGLNWRGSSRKTDGVTEEPRKTQPLQHRVTRGEVKTGRQTEICTDEARTWRREEKQLSAESWMKQTFVCIQFKHATNLSQKNWGQKVCFFIYDWMLLLLQLGFG